jgi:hypothetical protein
MIILGLLLEVMDLSAADLDNVTRPRLPANAASQPAAPAAPANGQSQLAALLGGLHGSWQRAQRQEKERATNTGSARTPYAASPSRSSGKGSHWPRCKRRCVAAGGDSVILANWVRRSERLALSENGDGTRAAAFAGARGSGRRRCTPMDTREGCGRPGEGMTTGSRHPTARNTFEPLQSGVPGPVG